MYNFHIVKSGNFNEVIPYYNYHINILYYKVNIHLKVYQYVLFSVETILPFKGE